MSPVETPVGETTRARRLAAPAGLVVLAAWVAGCASPPPAPVQAPAPAQSPAPAPAPPPPPAVVYVPVQEPSDLALRALLAFHERVAAAPPAALAAELQRLGDGRAAAATQGAAPVALELALVLGLTRAPGDLVRAQALLDGVLRDPQAQAWHALARWMSVRYAEQRRAEEQAERLAQQLRDQQREHQRRVEQLNDKLEALLSIERSLNTRPAPAPPPRTPP